jgi:hypothetical protein
MKKVLKRSLFLCLISLLFLVSCLKELDFDSITPSEWTSDWAIPLVSTSLSFGDVIKDTTVIVEDPDGLVTLVYTSRNLFSLTAQNLIEVPDQTHPAETQYVLPPAAPGEGKHLAVDLNLPFTTGAEEQRVDSIFAKGGKLYLTLSTNLNKDNAGIEVRLPSFIHAVTRDTMSIVFSGDYTGSLIVRDTVLDLDQYIAVIDNSLSPDEKIRIRIIFTFIGDNNPNLSPYDLQLELGIEDLAFSKFFGYAGTYDYELNDTIRLDINRLNEEGYFQFAEGSVAFYMTALNSYGMPVRLDIQEFKAFHDGSTPAVQDLYLFGQGVPAVFDINYPAYNQVGQTVLTNVNTLNSNITDVLNISPDRIAIWIDGVSNPEHDSTLLNFVLDTSRFSVDVDFELKLFGSINGFTVTDTFDYELDSPDKIESILFRILTTNSFPLEAEMQLTFVDSAWTVLGTLLEAQEKVVEGATVSGPPAYRTTEPGRKTVIAEVNHDKLQDIDQTRKLILTAKLSTTQAQNVKIYSDYRLDVSIGTKVRLKL